VEYIARDARAEDATDIAKLCYLAGRSHLTLSMYDLMVPGLPGMTDERIAAMADIIATGEPSWLSYRHYHVIEADGCVASGLATFKSEDADNKQLGKALASVGWSNLEMLKMVLRLRVWKEPGRLPGFLIIENVATFDEYRGRGFTTELLARAAQRAREGGLDGLQLVVMLGNEPAIRAYEKVGFEHDKTVESRRFEKAFSSPGACRMVLRF